MPRCKSCGVLGAMLALSALCRGGQGELRSPFPPGYLDWGKIVSWGDVKDLSRGEIAADQAIRGGHPAEAKGLLSALMQSGQDSVLVRKGLLDLNPAPSTLRSALAALKKRRENRARLSHADLLERGYAVAMLARVERGTPDLDIEDVLAGLHKVLNDGPTIAERVAAGEILSQIADLGEMRRVLAEAARLAPRRAGVQLACAWSLAHIGNGRYKSRPSEALPYALAAVREDPTRADAYSTVAGCYAELGDQARANRYCAEYVKHGDFGSPGVKAVRDYLAKRGIQVKG